MRKLALILLAACAAPGPRQEIPPPAGPAAPDFAEVAVDGRQVSLSSLRGKIVLVHFWARWCGACQGDLEIFQELHERFADRDVAVVGIVHASGSDAQVLAFAETVGLEFPNLQANDALREAYGAAVFPTTVVVDREGRVRYRANVRLNPGFWDRFLEDLLREDSASGP